MVGALIALAVLAPMVGSAVAMASPRLTPAGRAVTAGSALSTLSSAVLLVLSGVDTDGTVAGGLLDASIDRAGTLLLVVVMGTATAGPAATSPSSAWWHRVRRW